MRAARVVARAPDYPKDETVRRVAVRALLLTVALAIGWSIAAVILGHLPAESSVPPATARFGAFHPGMSLREAFESLPASGADRTALTLLPDNPTAWSARWRMLAEADRSIDASYFILREDVFGASFLGHLLHKARSGVRVRLLLDSQGTVMSFASPRGNDWLDTLANTRGAQVKLFRPIASRYLQAILTANPVAAVASEHDKILVCDLRVGILGGRNISAEYFADPRDLRNAFQDVDVVLHGERAARALTAAFETQYLSDGARTNARERVDLASFEEELLLAYIVMDDWVRGRPFDARASARIRELGLPWIDQLATHAQLRESWDNVPPPDTQAEVRLLDSPTRTDVQLDAIARALSRLIQSARKSALIQSPYLVLSRQAVDALADAGRRGVAITVYTNSPISSDNALSQAFFLEQWPRLLARVPNLRLFVSGVPRTLHSKLMVFDDQITLIGTYNLDPISMGVNSEIMAAVWSGPFARRAAWLTYAQLALGAPFAYEYTIERDAHGRPLRDENGEPIVAFGPQHHAPPEQWRKIQALWFLLRAADAVPGFSPFF